MITNHILKLHNLFGRALVLVQQETVLELFVLKLEAEFFVSLGRFFKLARFIRFIALLQVVRRHLVSLASNVTLKSSHAQRRLDGLGL